MQAQPATTSVFCLLDHGFSWSEEPTELKKQIKDYSHKIARRWGAATLHFLSATYHLDRVHVHTCLKDHLFALAKKTDKAVVTRGQLFARNSQHQTPRQIAETFSPQDAALKTFLVEQEAKIRAQLKADEEKYSPLVSFMASFEGKWKTAVTNKDWKALTDLVSSEQVTFENVHACVRAHIRSLATEFDGSYDERANQTQKVLQTVAQLTGSSFETLKNVRSSTYLKEMVHANGKITDGKVGEAELEYWDPLEFLPMHMLFLMRHVVALKSGWYEDGRLPEILSHDRHQIHAALATEIANEVLTYHCLRIANLLNEMAQEYPGIPLEKMHILFSSKESCARLLIDNPKIIQDLSFQYTFGIRSGWLTPDHNFSGELCAMNNSSPYAGNHVQFVTLNNDVALIKLQKELADLFIKKPKAQRSAMFEICKLFQMHARMVTRHIDSLNAKNPEFSYSTGCAAHSVEATFASYNGGVVVRIDNRGLWFKEDSEPNKAISRTLGEINPVRNLPKLQLYIIQLALALQKNKSEAETAEAKTLIYEPPQGVLRTSDAVSDALNSLILKTQWLSLDKQEINNCVHASHVMSMLQRFNAFLGKERAMALFEWLLSAEVVFSTTAPGQALIGTSIHASTHHVQSDDWF